MNYWNCEIKYIKVETVDLYKIFIYLEIKDLPRKLNKFSGRRFLVCITSKIPFGKRIYYKDPSFMITSEKSRITVAELRKTEDRNSYIPSVCKVIYDWKNIYPNLKRLVPKLQEIKFPYYLNSKYRLFESILETKDIL